jgi:phosphoglycerate dehydrogenase-like enzyme
MSNERKVLVCVNQLRGREAPYLRRLEAAGFTVVQNKLGRLYNESELIAALDGVYATIAGGEPYTERVFASAPGLKVVARFGVGYDQVDVAAATRHHVVVAMAFGANHEAVADGAFALMAGIAGDLVNRHNQVRNGGWGSVFHKGLWRATVGIIGLGRIGRAFARRCRGFDMHVLANDIVPDTAYAAANGISLVGFEELLRQADFVSLHVPHTKLTERMINATSLKLMRPTAYLINTARGALVDEAALADALRHRRIAGAGIDAFWPEPPVGSPLLQLDNILLTPHSTGMDQTAEVAMCDRCIDSILAVAGGNNPGAEYVLNPQTLPR